MFKLIYPVLLAYKHNSQECFTIWAGKKVEISVVGTRVFGFYFTGIKFLFTIWTFCHNTSHSIL
jgi:hypothetical protein